jgi:hypothetical protein
MPEGVLAERLGIEVDDAFVLLRDADARRARESGSWR